MDWTFQKRSDITLFINNNKESFEKRLLSEAVNVASNIQQILKNGNINLLVNAQKLVFYIIQEKEHELIEFAKQEGIIWAKHSLTLAFKLEWVQAIRRTLWHFLYEYNEKAASISNIDEFFVLEKKINDQIDSFLNYFFLSYSNYKDELIETQRKTVEHLSVPIIPVSPTVAVLPLIGMVDSFRISTIEEKVLLEIDRLKLHTLVIDLSGIISMDEDIIDHFKRIISGVTMMGSKVILTGLRPDLVKYMVHTGITFDNNVVTEGTLQQTIKKYLVIDQ